jgi:uncharacterized protein (TIGR03435 family)
MRSPNGRVTGVNVVPMLLITSAYGVAGFEVLNAPAWLSSERYDVNAKAPDGNPSGEQSRLMMQSLLEDRFQLKVHRETKEGAVLKLSVAKSGIKLRPVQEGSCFVPGSPGAPSAYVPGQKPPCGMIMPGRNGVNQTMDAAGLKMDMLARTLSLMLGTKVVNATGLAGAFDGFHLEYAPARLNGPGVSDAAGASIYTALPEQAGLKLEAGKGPVEFLVIDRVERPGEN